MSPSSSKATVEGGQIVFFNCLDLNWRSLLSGGVWYKSNKCRNWGWDATQLVESDPLQRLNVSQGQLP